MRVTGANTTGSEDVHTVDSVCAQLCDALGDAHVATLVVLVNHDYVSGTDSECVGHTHAHVQMTVRMGPLRRAVQNIGDTAQRAVDTLITDGCSDRQLVLAVLYILSPRLAYQTLMQTRARTTQSTAAVEIQARMQYDPVFEYKNGFTVGHILRVR